MPYFVVTIEYTKPMDLVEQHTPAHREFCAGLQGPGGLIASGPFNPRTGGMLILQADSVDKAVATFDDDPFRKHDLAKYEIREWIPKIGADLFA